MSPVDDAEIHHHFSYCGSEFGPMHQVLEDIRAQEISGTYLCALFMQPAIALQSAIVAQWS